MYILIYEYYIISQIFWFNYHILVWKHWGNTHVIVYTQHLFFPMHLLQQYNPELVSVYCREFLVDGLIFYVKNILRAIKEWLV